MLVCSVFSQVYFSFSAIENMKTRKLEIRNCEKILSFCARQFTRITHSGGVWSLKDKIKIYSSKDLHK